MSERREEVGGWEGGLEEAQAECLKPKKKKQPEARSKPSRC